MLRAPSTFIAAAAVVLLVYAVSLAVMPKRVFWSPDEGAKLIQAETIRWNLDYEVAYGARELDPDLALYPSRCRHNDIYPDPSRGKVRLHWPIWFSLFSKGAYALFGPTGLYLLPMICGWLVAVASGWLMRLSFPDLSAVAVLVVGLASPIFFYSLCFWEHTPATLLGILALAWVAKRQTADVSTLAVVGVLVALAILLRVEMVAFGLSLVAAWFLSLRTGTTAADSPDRAKIKWRIAAGAVLIFVGVFLLVLTPRHWESEPLHRGLWLYALRKSPALLDAAVAVLSNAPGHQAPIVSWRWELLGLCAFLACIAGAMLRSRPWRPLFLVPGLAVTISFSLVLLLWRQPYISLHGFVPLAPYVALAPLGAVFAWQAREMALVPLAWTAGIYLVLGFGAIFVFFVRQDGGYLTGLEWGTRNLLTLYPIAAILCLVSWKGVASAAGERALVAVLGVTILLGLNFQVRGIQMLIRSHQLVEEWQATLPTNEPVVTDVWWLPAAMAPYFLRHAMMCATDPDVLAAWIPGAAKAGVDGFTFASLEPIPERPWSADVAGVKGEAERRTAGLYLRRFRISDAAVLSGSRS